jgi:hypothetical protein
VLRLRATNWTHSVAYSLSAAKGAVPQELSRILSKESQPATITATMLTHQPLVLLTLMCRMYGHLYPTGYVHDWWLNLMTRAYCSTQCRLAEPLRWLAPFGSVAMALAPQSHFSKKAPLTEPDQILRSEGFRNLSAEIALWRTRLSHETCWRTSTARVVTRSD